VAGCCERSNVQGQVAGCCERSNDSDKWRAVVSAVMIVTSGGLL
jgi:hypothetical protein